MQINWPENIKEAGKMQDRHKRMVQVIPLTKEPETIAGVDAAFTKDKVFAAACLYRYPEMHLVGKAFIAEDLRFPYVPGYLLFTEGPALIAAIRELRTRPDLLLVDGHGIAHPERIGSASHLGVLLNIATIGCAKTRLVGDYQEPGLLKGDWSGLNFRGETVGAVVRTRDRTRPVFLSPGHRIDLQGAIKIILACVGKYRIPEPMRCADMLAKKMKARAGMPAGRLS